MNTVGIIILAACHILNEFLDSVTIRELGMRPRNPSCPLRRAYSRLTMG